MVNIEYTGVDGNVSRIASSSANEAMSQLQGVNGYNGNIMDSVAANLASAFASRHNINAERVKGITTQRTRFSGVSGGNMFASRNGSAARIKTITGVEVKDGKIVTQSRSSVIDENGNFVSVGGNKEEIVGTL